MSGDYSRDSFDALRDYAGVFMQQGRAALDADWNELARVFERRIRAGTVDTIGRAVVPRETLSGFQIQLLAGPEIEIGRGRLYLDGMLLECHGAANFPGPGDEDFADPMFDRSRTGTSGPEGVLDELISAAGSDFLPYGRQPYWPAPAALPETAGPHLVYLVGWQREVTPLENPGLLEPALGGIDTAARWQNVWQVRLLPDVGANATCATPDDELAGWVEAMAPSTARLSTDTIDIEDPEDPCLVPPTDGYTGIENQFYRVELHTVGDAQGDARFKFSRENASVAAAIESFTSPADRVTVRRIGRDKVLRFRAGDWVEITDDIRELDHRSGQLLRVAQVHEETREIELEGTVTDDFVPGANHAATVEQRRSRMIRWDQRGVIRLTDGSEWVNLDAATSDGLIPVPPDGTAIVLESGISVSFATAPGPGRFREMDHWRFAARTAGTQIETLETAPPDGVQRHYCRLAIVTFPSSVQDCRVFWPPETGGEAESCGCTVCVTPDSHNSGALTIQAAIDQIGPEGGTVCLDGGSYVLEAPVTIAGRLALTLRGQGLATVLLYQGAGGGIRVSGSVDVQVERLSLIALPRSEDDVDIQPTVHGITVANSAFLALRRLAVLVIAGGEARQDHGIAIDGTAIGDKIEECLVLAPVALGSLSSRDSDQEGPSFLALAEIRVIDNILFGARAAVRFEGLALNIAGAIFSRNLMLGTDAGVLVNWLEPPTGSTAIRDNTAIANGDAMRLGASDLRLLDNEISGGPQIGDGVRIVPSLIPQLEIDAQVVGNRIGDLAGAGLRIEGALGALMVKRNIIRRCGEAGILSGPDATIRHAAIDNNVIEGIADAIEQGAASALALVRVETGQISGNSVRGVGAGGPPTGFYSGIALQGMGTVAIESNVVTEIGPDSTASPAIGILALGPFAGLSLRGNRLIGATDGANAEGSGWTGIVVAGTGTQPDDTTPGVVTSVPGFNPAEVAFAEVDGRAYSLSFARLADLGPVRERQLTIGGNQLYHGADSEQPMVLAVSPTGTTVVFCDNQCRLEAPGRVPTLVWLAAERIVAGNNVVRRQSDADAMWLVVGQSGRATVLGNLTFGNIRVQPGGLQAPFDALNLLAS